MNKSLFSLLSVTLVTSSLLVGCTSSEPVSKNPTKPAEQKAEEPVGEPKPGGIVTYAYNQPFKGLLDRSFYEGEDDNLALNFMTDPMIMPSDDLKASPYMAEWKESPDHSVYTFTIKKGIKWHNGDELTAEDWKFAFEVLAHPDSKGQRLMFMEMIKGVKDYRAGKAQTISGLKVLDSHTLEITMEAPKANAISNLWAYPMPKKYFEGVAIKDMENSPQVRQKPIGTGPFKVKTIKSGEYIEFERFDDYWQGKPLLDGVVYKIIDGELSTSLVKNGEVDMLFLPRNQFQEAEKLENAKLYEVNALSYAYIGFKFGRYDEKQKKSISDNPKFQNKQLRQAMAYALDRQGLIEAFENGKGTVINSPMPSPMWAKTPESELTPYEYNPEKAKQLLDEAGYKDVTGDGLREDPSGKPFSVNFEAMSGSEIAEPRAQAIIQYWREVGVDAKLNGGTLKEFNVFYDTLGKDDPSIDAFMGAWSLPPDPDPSGLWKEGDVWNLTRWTNKESDRLIDEAVGPKAADLAYRKEMYKEWQKLTNEELPVIPLSSRKDVTVANKRLQGVRVHPVTNQVDIHKWWVTK